MAYRYHIGRGVLRRGYTKAFHVSEQQDSYITYAGDTEEPMAIVYLKQENLSQALTIAKQLIVGWEKNHEDNE